MGRGRVGKSRTQRRHFRDGRDNAWKPDNSGDPNRSEKPSWQPFATQNQAFDEYYKEQGIVSADEWDTFVEVLRSPLPAAFRINSSSQFCADIKMQLENDFSKSLQAETNDGSEVEAIRPLPWYPGNLAWHSNFSRMQLRKNQTLERFHEFLKLENEIGNITRQEAVSMVPPLFLDVQPGHFVLDMCAAPGSKTFQLLEIIYQSMKPGTLPDGMVIANDLDVQRCNLLIHQTKRMCTANLVVTNNEAQQFPSCRSNKGCSKAPEMEFEPSICQLLFDRVLCDVPCSGDGTLRKAPDLWRKWSSGMGNGLHTLQFQIAMRGLSLLKVGGKMVYSTCSMNPVENEAVVAVVLRRCCGSVELVDVSSELPQLVRRPGLRSWKKIKNRTMSESMVKIQTREFIQWGDSDILSEYGNFEVSDLPLERCMRIVPNENSGAFFIAMLKKLSPLPAIQEKPGKLGKSNNKRCHSQEKLADQVVEDNEALETISEVAATECSSALAVENDLICNNSEKIPLETDPHNTSKENDLPEAQETVSGETECGIAHKDVNGDTESGKAIGKRKLQMQGRWKGVDPVLFFKDEAIINSIRSFYGIDESFPFEGHLVSRNVDENHVKRIYYLSKSVKNALELNFLAGQQLKIASVGLKTFERQSSIDGSDAPCAFRISSKGLPMILPHITRQILYASLADFKHLLQYKAIKYRDFVDPEFGDLASKLMMGCCVIVLKGDGKISSESTKVDSSTVAMGCWKGGGSLSVMVTAIDCQELLERLSVRIDGTSSSLQRNYDGGEVQKVNGNDEEIPETAELAAVS